MGRLPLLYGTKSAKIKLEGFYNDFTVIFILQLYNIIFAAFFMIFGLNGTACFFISFVPVLLMIVFIMRISWLLLPVSQRNR
jgi:hypothetical protein